MVETPFMSRRQSLTDTRLPVNPAGEETEFSHKAALSVVPLSRGSDRLSRVSLGECSRFSTIPKFFSLYILPESASRYLQLVNSPDAGPRKAGPETAETTSGCGWSSHNQGRKARRGRTRDCRLIHRK